MAKIVSRARKILRCVSESLLDVFFPRQCLVCGNVPDAPGFRFLSVRGRAMLRFIGDEACPYCGAPQSGIVSEHGECVFCRNRKFSFRRSRSLVVLDEYASRLVHAFKYNSFHAAASDLAQLIAEHEDFSRFLAGAVLVPVPLFRSKENDRGYNQSFILAREIVRRIPETHIENLLVRTRNTGTQTRLSATSRARNVRDAFAVPEKYRERIAASTRYVVIDDVFTTGSTLSECARALKKAGAKTVDAATFAHG